MGRFAVVSSVIPHHGEEYCFSGRNGSGTIFFGGCNLGCVFCQNWELSHEVEGRPVSAEILAKGMIRLQHLGCHNINLVSPTHVVPQILEALPIAAAEGLNLPIVYNTGGYDSPDILALLDGVVDIYMPDLKFLGEVETEHYLHAGDYPETAKRAIRIMHDQVGDLTLNGEGIASRGLLVRHLVMPGQLENTRNVLRFLAQEISKDTAVNIMGQYHTAGDARDFPELHGRVTAGDLAVAREYARSLGLHRFY